MGLVIDSLERGSYLHRRAINSPLIPVPPNVEGFFVAGVVIPSAGPFPIPLTVGRRGWGGSSTVHVNVTTLGDWTAGDSLTIRITGLDHNLVPVTEDVTIVFVADATDCKRSNTMFRRIDSATAIAATGAFTTAAFGIGIGNATSTDSEPFYIRMPMPSKYVRSHLDFVWQLYATAALVGQTDTTSAIATAGRIQGTVLNGEAFSFSQGGGVSVPTIAALTFTNANNYSWPNL